MRLCSLLTHPEPDTICLAKACTVSVHNCFSHCCHSHTLWNSLNTQHIVFWHWSLEQICCAMHSSELAEIKQHFVDPRRCSLYCSEHHKARFHLFSRAKGCCKFRYTKTKWEKKNYDCSLGWVQHTQIFKFLTCNNLRKSFLHKNVPKCRHLEKKCFWAKIFLIYSGEGIGR